MLRSLKWDWRAILAPEVMGKQEEAPGSPLPGITDWTGTCAMSIFDRMLESSNRNPPTNQQLIHARELGLEVKAGMSLEEVSAMIRKAKTGCAPERSQLTRAGELGIPVGPQMTHHEVGALIRKAESSGPPAEYQLAEARALGVQVNDEMSRAELETLIRKAAIRNPPLESQLEICAQIGLPVKPGMTRGQVEKLLNYARSNPRYANRFDPRDVARRAADDQQLRDQFGDKLVDELCTWRKRNDGRQYLVVFRKDQQLHVDVALIESASLEAVEPPRVVVGMALPLVISGDEPESDYLEWGNDECLPAAGIQCARRLKSDLEPPDLIRYWQLIAYGQQLAETADQSLAPRRNPSSPPTAS